MAKTGQEIESGKSKETSSVENEHGENRKEALTLKKRRYWVGKKIILVAPCAPVFWDQKFKLCSDSFRTKEINYCFSCYAAPAKVLDHMFL